MEWHELFYGGEFTMTKDTKIQIGLCFLLIIIAVLFAGCLDSKTTVIKPDCRSRDCGGYYWGERDSLGMYMLTITKPGEYTFLKNARFPSRIGIYVASSGVTLDGSGVTLTFIIGQPDLDLKNITIDDNSYFDASYSSGTAITECRNIKNSSIHIAATSQVTGIENLYGTMDGTTSITVISGVNSAYGVSIVDGTISGGTITVRGGYQAYGVYRVNNTGTISGGKYTVYGLMAAVGVGTNRGTISGGTFSMASDYNVAYGVYEDFGTVSGATFTVNGKSV